MLRNVRCSDFWLGGAGPSAHQPGQHACWQSTARSPGSKATWRRRPGPCVGVSCLSNKRAGRRVAPLLCCRFPGCVWCGPPGGRGPGLAAVTRPVFLSVVPVMSPSHSPSPSPCSNDAAQVRAAHVQLFNKAATRAQRQGRRGSLRSTKEGAMADASVAHTRHNLVFLRTAGTRRRRKDPWARYAAQAAM